MTEFDKIMQLLDSEDIANTILAKELLSSNPSIYSKITYQQLMQILCIDRGIDVNHMSRNGLWLISIFETSRVSARDHSSDVRRRIDIKLIPNGCKNLVVTPLVIELVSSYICDKNAVSYLINICL